MRRREFIAIAAGAAAWPHVAKAAQLAMPVIGFLGAGTAESTTSELKGFREGLADTGYIEDRNLNIEYCWSEGKSNRLSALAADLVHDQVALIAVTTQ